MENNKEKKWYILNVVSGQENKIANEINLLITTNKISEFVSEVLVPYKKVPKIKRGQKVLENQKLFPGYIFIKANINSNAYNSLNAIPKVIGFLGGKNNPQQVDDSKMEEIFSIINEQGQESKVVAFEIGESVNVIDGPFESFAGVVEEFDVEKRKVKISILIFGRATSVELGIEQVEKIS